MARRRRVLVGVAAAAAISLIAAGAALGALTYTQYDYPLTDNDQMSDYSSCGTKLDPIGGGIYITGSGLGIEVNYTYPADSAVDPDKRPDGWEVGANSDGSGDQTLTDHLICSDLPLSYPKVGRSLPLDSDRSARANCPGDRHVASGGVYITDPNDLQREVVETYPVDDGDADKRPDDGWVGRASNYGSAGDTKLQVFAVCSPHNFSYRFATKRVGASTQVGKSVSCGKGDRVVGGGMEITKPGDETESATVAPFDGDDADAKADDGWGAWANNESSKARRMTTWAICL